MTEKAALHDLADLVGAEDAIALRGLTLGRPLTVLGTTGSTNDEAKRGQKDGAPHGAAWVADQQTEGRGRQGRAWIAAPGDALLFSVLLRISCPASRVPPLSLIAGLAALEAASRAAPNARLGLKWPNDVVAIREDGSLRKIAGVLVEASIAGAEACALIVGIGINVHTRAFPEPIADVAESLARLAPEASIPRKDVLVAALAALDRDLPRALAHGLSPFASRLAAADVLAGRRVTSENGEGIAEGIDVEGRLLVRSEVGDRSVMRWGAGEVHLNSFTSA